MQVTNRELLAANQVLNDVAPAISDTVVRFRFIQTGKAMAEHVKSFYEAQEGLIEKYGQKDDEGNPVPDDNGNVIWQEGKAVDARNELAELLDAETELNVKPIALSKLAESLEAPLEYHQIEAISWLLLDDLD